MTTSILHNQIKLQQTATHTYTISWHRDWAVGRVLHGGSVAAAIHLAALSHLGTTLAAQNQPDVLTIHFHFLRPCELRGSVINVVDLKIGAVTSDLQLQLLQGEQVRVIALATAVNFDKLDQGPSAPTAWKLQPEPKPVDFDRVLRHQRDENWISAHVTGEIIPFTGRQIVLNPREGFPVDGICDAWNTFLGEERMDAIYLTMMTDCIPSMSDTLLRNNGLYDVHKLFALLQEGDRKNPGVPVELKNTLKEAMQAKIFNNSITLDIEFKRRVPPEGIKWTFTRAATRMFAGGRLDLDVTICDENLDVLVLSRQVILALDAGRKFSEKRANSSL